MIGKLKGVIDLVESNYILLNVHDVYYKIFLPAIILKHRTEGEPFACFTYFHVRENEISLYGFPDQEYQHIFDLLLGVPGVGPKSALTIIGFNQLSFLVEAVSKQDATYFSQIPGVGKKTAQKILLDLSNKFSVEYKPEKNVVTIEEKTIIDALLSLGFSRNEANDAIKNIDQSLPLEEKITLAIRSLNTHGN